MKYPSIFSIRDAIPLILFVFIIFYSVYDLAATIRAVERDTIAKAAQDAGIISQRVTGYIETDFRKHDPESVKTDVADMALLENVDTAFLVSPEGNLTASTRPGTDEKTLPDALGIVFGAEREAIGQVIGLAAEGHGGQRFVDKQGRYIVSAYPVEEPGVNPPRVSVLVLRYSIAGAISENRSRVISEMTQDFIILSALFVFVWVLMTRLVTNRVAAISGMIRRFAAGDYTGRTGMRAGDELGTIGAELDNMADMVMRKESELKESGELYKSFVTASPDAVIITDIHSNIIYAGHKACELVRAPADTNIRGMSALEWVGPEHKIKALRNISKVLRGGQPDDNEYLLNRYDGTGFYAEVNAAPLFDANNKVKGILAIIRDVTYKKQSDNILRESEKRLKAVLNFSPLPKVIFDKAGKISFVNRQFTRVFGYTPDMVGSLRELCARLSPDDNTCLSLNDLLLHPDSHAEDMPVREVNVKTAGGGICAINLYTAITDNDIFIIFQDITEQKKAEEALRASEEKFRTLVQSMDNIVFTMGTDERYSGIYGKALNGGAAKPELFIGKTAVEIFGDEGGKVHHEANLKALAGEDVSYEWELAGNGESAYLMTSLSPIFGPSGQVAGIAGIGQDITTRKKMEEELRSERDFAESLIETAQVIILVLDTQGNIVRYNRYLESLSGWSLNDMAGKNWIENFIPVNEQGRIEGLLESAVSGTETRGNINAILTRSGEERFVEWYDKVLRDSSGKITGLLAIGQDITARRKTEEALRASEARFRKMFENHNAVMILVEPESGDIVDINESGSRFYGYPRAQLCAMNISSINLMDSVQLKKSRMEVLTNKKNYFAVEHKLANGDIRNVEVHSSPINIEGKDLLFAIVHDITERKQVEMALLNSEARYHEIFEQITDYVLVLEQAENGPPVIVDASNSAFVKHGYEREEMIGKPITFLDMEESKVMTRNEDVFNKGFSRFEVTHRCRDGSSFVAEVVAKVITVGGKQLIYTIERDITERRQAEEALRASGQRLLSIISSSPIPMGIADRNGAITYINEKFTEVFGYSNEEIPTVGVWFEKAYPDAAYRKFIGDKWYELVSVAMGAGTPIPILEVHATAKNGSVHDVNLYTTMIGTDTFVMLQDVTEQKQAEETIRRVGSYNRSLIEVSLDPLVTISADGKITDVNKATEKATGCSREELIGTDFSDYFTEPDKAREGYQKVFAEGSVQNYPLEIKSKNSKTTPVLYNASVYRDETGSILGVFAAARDVTEQKQAEMELRKLYNDFVTLLESTGDFIYFKDKESRILFCSQALADMTGHGNWREMVGKHDTEVFPPDTARIYYEEELPIFREGKPIINKIDPYYDEHGKKRWVNTNKWPVFADDKQSVVGIFGISRDVTELIEAEEKIKNINEELEAKVKERTAQLEAANRELETFTYSASHDLRAPLRAIDGFSLAVLEDYGDKLDEDGRDYLNRVRKASHKMGELIDDFLTLSRLSRDNVLRDVTNLSGIAADVIRELKEREPERADVEVRIDDYMVDEADPHLVEVVLTNLLGNAWKFTSKKDDAMIEFGSMMQDNRKVYYVRDNGAGFNMEYASKLFQPFQRLHTTEEFRGTGIGLATVYRIINKHGGSIWAEGEVGRGAVFYFTLN